MEEDAGISVYKLLRDRYGVVIKTVNLPTNDAYSDQEVLDRFAAQLTPNTKAILFSSPIYLTGARLPAKDLPAVRRRGHPGQWGAQPGPQHRLGAATHRQRQPANPEGPHPVLHPMGRVGPPGDRGLHRLPGPVPARPHGGHLGPQCLSIPYDDPAETAGRTGLTSFNPFSPGYDYNAPLTSAQSSAQRTASGAAVTAMRANHNIVIRNNSVPHALRTDPSQNAAAGTFSTPLRISTHLFHSLDDVDRVIEALLQVVPHP